MINGERGTGRAIFYDRRIYFQLKKGQDVNCNFYSKFKRFHLVGVCGN